MLFRLRIALFLSLVFSTALVGKLFYLQVVKGSSYRAMAENQRSVTFEVPAERGKVFASGGLLVTNEEAYRVVADPRLIDNPKKTAEEITSILFEDSRFLSYNPLPSESPAAAGASNSEKLFVEKLTELLSLKDRLGVDLARKVPTAQVAKIKSLGVPGLGFYPDNRRFYPEGSLASSLLGFVAFSQDGERGYNGLEGYYDGDLRGRDGSVRREYNDKKTEPILIGDSTVVDPQNGSDLYLTINRGVQSILERKIVQGVKRYGAKSGSFIVLDPETGYVLAMGNYPSFDPGNFNSAKKEMRNLGLATTYEPGSIIKPITVAAGLDSEKIKPDWTFVDSGKIKIGIYSINTWDGEHWGKQNLVQLLQRSNNIGSAKLALEIGRESLRSYFLNFGFGEQTGIDLVGEEGGLVKDIKDWREIDLANAGFGQGVGVTDLQMAAAFAALVNKGVLMQPQVVERIVGRDGRVVSFSPKPNRMVVSEQTATTVVNMLREAAVGGESAALKNLPYRVAGKTGTAEIAKGGRYDPNKTNATFVGFPLKDRSFVMLNRLEEPSATPYAAYTAMPLWAEAFREIAPLFGISPDK
ncbi:MAG: penicillin-binding protein 2 [Patescibacteria group bacterium]